MNILAWFEPLLSDGIVHRLESVDEVNKRATRELLDTERRYWRGIYTRADTEEDVAMACAELDKLDELARRL